MAFKLNKNDRELLAQIAEFRLLTVKQIADLRGKASQVVRRRLRELKSVGLVEPSDRLLGHGAGRPETVFSLSPKGIDVLRRDGVLYPGIEDDKVSAQKLRCKDHQLLGNWFWIHLDHISRMIPLLSIRFLSPTSPFLKRNQYDQPLVCERIQTRSDPDDVVRFTPDGVFSITDTESQKTLLFFLEVDMATEALASTKREPRDIRQKVINYQAYFRMGLYKRYEKIWNCNLNGFRMLLLTNTNGRMSTLCRLIQKMPPSDFIWVTDQERMFRQGLSGEIWARGGKHEAALLSILGPKMARPNPILRK